MPEGRMFVSSFARATGNETRLCTLNKWLNLDEPIFAHIYMLIIYLRLSNFIQFLDVLGIRFQDSDGRQASAYVKSA